MNPIYISDNGIKMIAGFEGTIYHLYYDVAGIQTVCTGHVTLPGEDWSTVTKEKCEATLGRDLGRFVRAVLRSIEVPFSQPMLDAFVSLAFNIGEAGFEMSSVAKFMNQGNYLAAADAFLLWCNAKVKQKDGTFIKKPVLLGRRQSERKVFLSGINEITMGTEPEEISIVDLVAATQFDLRNTRIDLPAGIELEDNDLYADDGRLVALPPQLEESLAA